MEGRAHTSRGHRPVPSKGEAFDKLLDRVVSDPNFTATAAAIAFLVVVLTFVLIKLCSRGSSSRKNILLLGLAEAGKTTMFTRLVTGKTVQTVTSMKENQGTVKIGNRTFSLVDLPGYDRLRRKYFDDFKPTARAVIFVVDSLEFLSNLRDVADFLYTVLSDPIISGRKTRILIACNKQDEPKAKTARVLQRQLEKEIQAIRETRAAALDSTAGDSGDKVVLLGNTGKDFEWTDIKNKVEFVDCTSLDDDSLEPVGTWILSL